RVDALVAGLPGGDVGDLRIENAFDAGKFFVDHIGDAMRSAAQRAARRRHAIAHQLIAAENVEQLELHAEGVLPRLRELPDYDGFDSEYRPVIEIDIRAGGRLLQHVRLVDRCKPAASLKIRGNDTSYIDRRIHIAVPAERDDSNR